MAVAKTMQGPITQDDVRKIIRIIRAMAPEFKAVGDKEIRQYIEIFSLMIGRRVYGARWHLALALLICHKMKMAGMGDTKYGTVAESMRLSSVSEGDSSLSFNSSQAPTADADSEFLLTSYGVQFLSIRRRTIIPVYCGGMNP